MRTITANMAKLIMLGLFFVFSNATLATPAYAGGDFWKWWDNLEKQYGDCHFSGGSIKCKKTNVVEPHAPSSTGLFVTRCNGQVGWWNAIPFQDGTVLCVAMSTADFYHNDGSLGGATCTKTKLKHHHHVTQETTNGACRTYTPSYWSPALQ